MGKNTMFTLGAALFFLCTPYEGVSAPDLQKISPQAAKALMADAPAHVLLDVRTDEEYANSHIQGAQLIPHTEIAARASRELPDKNMLIIIYCRTGTRSAVAASQLFKMGYTNVYDLGSIDNWPDKIIKN